MPFSPTGYVPQYGDRIAELMMRQGEIAARGAERSGLIWGRAIENLGEIAGQAVGKYQEKKEAGKRGAAFEALMADGRWQQDPTILLSGATKIFGPEHGPVIARAAYEWSKITGKGDAEDEKRIGHTLTGLALMPDAEAAPLWEGGVRNKLTPWMANRGIPEEQVPAKWVPGMQRQVGYYGRMLTGEAAPKPEGELVETADPQGNPVKRRATEAELASPGGVPVWKKPDEASYQSKDVLLDGQRAVVGFNPKTMQYFRPGANGTLEDVSTRVKPIPPASISIQGGRLGAAEADEKVNALSILEGRLNPSILSKRENQGLMAEVDRLSMEKNGRHFNFNKAMFDYEAAKKHVAAMNSKDQYRFRSLATSVVNTIDEVKALAEQLKLGSVQKYNMARRETIAQLYGNTKQSAIAAKYLTAVNTLKEEFANLAQGGYAPTEAAWKLANEQINGDYGLKDFVSSVDEAQRLINLRMEAFQETGAAYMGGYEGQGGAPAAPPGGTGAAPPRPPSVPANYKWDEALGAWRAP